MPNHVMNRISVIGDDQKQTKLRQIAEFLRPAGKPLGYVDFNKLIPMPPSLQIEAGSRGEQGLKLYREYINAVAAISGKAQRGQISEQQKESRLSELKERYVKIVKEDPEVFELGKQYYDNLQQHGCTTWYEWSIRHWGTKWNAYDCIPFRKDTEHLTFSTAWSGVPRILSFLSKQFPGMEIEYKWADEDIGQNVGHMIFQGGELTEDLSPCSDSREAYEQAAELWDLDLESEGFRLDKDGSAYEYCEQEAAIVSLPEPRKDKTRSRGGAR